MSTPESKMVPVTLMIDLGRHAQLKAASKSTRISMSELVRLSIDGLMSKIGDPERPSAEGLATILLLSGGGVPTAEVKSSKKKVKTN